MSTFNESLSRVASGLLNPKNNAPTLDQRFTHLSYEYQSFYNELSTTNLPWTYNEQLINVQGGQTDYLVTNAGGGKVLFVIAYPQNTNLSPVSLEFADLAAVSSDFFLYSPLDYGYAPDFNEAVNFPFPFQIAFFRKNNDLWLRLPPLAYTLTQVKIVFSTGDWLANLQIENTAVLSQHHQLVEVRTMLNLLPGAEWLDEDIYTATPGRRLQIPVNQTKRGNLGASLARQEVRYSQQFMYAKRAMTADDQVTERVPFGGDW